LFLLHPPSTPRINQFLIAMRAQPLTYPEQGATRRTLPAGYRHDHSRIRLGAGAAAFTQAAEALRHWRTFALGWARLIPDDAPIDEGTTVAVVAHHFGFWSMSACRIVYVLEEPRRFGFAYGTLPAHVERGEERFMVEWCTDDSVWYDILAFSRPNHWLVRLGYPITRLLQKRFARDSLRVMQAAVNV
jgi:uncharacterized protein (UPF0548 family)